MQTSQIIISTKRRLAPTHNAYFILFVFSTKVMIIIIAIEQRNPKINPAAIEPTGKSSNPQISCCPTIAHIPINSGNKAVAIVKNDQHMIF